MRLFSRIGRVLIPALAIVGGAVDLRGQVGGCRRLLPRCCLKPKRTPSRELLAVRLRPVVLYAAWLRSPVVLSGRKIVGDYLLVYKGALPPKLTEIAILMTARHWTQQYIWHSHVALATKAGVRRGCHGGARRWAPSSEHGRGRGGDLRFLR